MERRKLGLLLAALLVAILAGLPAFLELLGIEPRGVFSGILSPWPRWLPFTLVAVALAVPLIAWHVRGVVHLSQLARQEKTEMAREHRQETADAIRQAVAGIKAARNRAREEAKALRAELADAKSAAEQAASDAASAHEQAQTLKGQLAAKGIRLEQSEAEVAAAQAYANDLRQRLAEAEAAKQPEMETAGTNKDQGAVLNDLRWLYAWQANLRTGTPGTLAKARAAATVERLIDRGVLDDQDRSRWQAHAFQRRLAKLIAAEEARLGILPPDPAPL